MILLLPYKILKGQTQDSNSYFLCHRLRLYGHLVTRISIVGDCEFAIAAEVKSLSARHSMVLTTGGIGPTHDDVTFAGVARAFGQPLVEHPELLSLCQQFFGPSMPGSPHLKLACVPATATLNYGHDPTTGDRLPFPVVSVGNVFVFPGIPALLERSFEGLEHLFRNGSQTISTELYLVSDEVSVAGVLSEAQAAFTDLVSIGSYPDWQSNYHRVKVTVDGLSKYHVEHAKRWIVERLPSAAFIKLETRPELVAEERVYALAEKDSELGGRVREALNIINATLSQHLLSELSLAFNGGKDCTALLHLLHAALCRKFPTKKKSLLCLYVRQPESFPELEKFIEQTCHRYAVKLRVLEGGLLESLAEFRNSNPTVRAVLMGTRATDPSGRNLQEMAPTDPDWPQFMRINPLLNWSYEDVWAFLRSLHVPYCVLYDRGYTSLGNRRDTERNPALRYKKPEGIWSYRPAYTLQQSDQERTSRKERP
uniref:FAD synthase n=1 Tax=Eptatretus burgeri TaxID=7764 RepID=A0A8C4QJ04_EPTBU